MFPRFISLAFTITELTMAAWLKENGQQMFRKSDTNTTTEEGK